MIDLYYWTTPNGHKLPFFLEEAQIDYKIIPVNIGRGEQFEADFWRLRRITAYRPLLTICRTGALCPFLNRALFCFIWPKKTGRFLPADRRHQVIQWLMWQMGGLGPMLGQNHHFRAYADEQVAYAVRRYEKEAQRLYAVLNKQLERAEIVFAENIPSPIWLVILGLCHMKNRASIWPIIRKCADGLHDWRPPVRWCKLIKRAPPKYRAHDG